MYPTIDPNSEEVQAGLELARQAGAAKLAAERQAAEARERQAQAAVDAEIGDALARALEMYQACKPLYESRELAAMRLKTPLAEYVEAENKIREKLDEIAAVLEPLRVRVDPHLYKRHTDRLRAQAGLPDHSAVGIDPLGAGAELALTIAQGITKGNIGAGYIRAGNSTAKIGK